MTDIYTRDQQPATPALEAEAITTKERSQLQLVMTRFLRHKLAVVSLVALVLLVGFAFLGPLFWQWGHKIDRDIPSNVPWFLDFGNPEVDPDHPLGTTQAGQDGVGLVMRGAQQSLKVALVVSLMVGAIASLWGAVAGLLRGWLDGIMMRLVDVVLVIPPLVLVAAVAGNIRGGTTWFAVALVIGFFGWPIYARVIRGVVLSLREQEFVEAARAMGASSTRIVLRHLLPNLTGPIIVSMTVVAAIAILAEAGLSFLQVGIQPPDTSLGLQVTGALTAINTRPWLFYPPGFMILLIALTINFIGDGLRDALDPRQTMVRR